MLIVQRRGPRILFALALFVAFLLLLHLSSFPVALHVPKWTLSATEAESQHDRLTHPTESSQHDRLTHPTESQHDRLTHPTPEWSAPLQSSSAFNPILSSDAPDSSPKDASDGTDEVEVDDPTPIGTGSLHTPAAPPISATGLPCQSLQGGDDVLIIMRTGATETQDKLSVHLNTTFQCYPHLVIFSDYEEDFYGYHIHDVLRHIPDSVKSANAEFQHYLHVQSVGRDGLKPSELSGAVSEETGGTGKQDNPGWALDKWKFLPMANETYALYPDKKYYVFLEPDSYLVWSNFLQWIKKVDPVKALYFGSQVGIGDIVFAHGGSIFMLTQPALKLVYEAYNNQTDELNRFTAEQWAGDAVLGQTLKTNGVPLTFSFPQFQGGNPSFSLDWEGKTGDRALWCTPALSYHHLVPYEIDDFWKFEQGWIEDVQAQFVQRGLSLDQSDANTLLLHRDTFKLYVMPNMTGTRDDWDAKPDTLHRHKDDNHFDLDSCRALCEDEPNCWQYTLGPEGCSTGGYARFGQEAKGYRSGWLIERVQRWVEKIDHCSNTDWITTG